MSFNYYQPTKIIFGNGKISTIGEETAAFGKRVLIATVPLFPAIEGGFQKIKTACGEAGVEVFHFDGVVPNPTKECVDEGSALAREKKVDVVIGYGGGSSMDVAKAIALGGDGVVIGTAEMVALECTRCGNCESGRGCPRGIATTDPELSRMYDTDWGAQRLINLFHSWSVQLHEILWRFGMKSVKDLVGRTDLLVHRDYIKS